MGFPFHTAKKLVMFILMGILPLVVFLLILALNVFFGFAFELPVMAGAGILTALILIPFAFKVTNSPFLKMWEGTDYGVITMDDTGKLDFFTVKYAAGNLVGQYAGQEIVEKFNRKFFFYLSSVFGKGTAIEQNETLTLTLEKNKYTSALFKTEFPILIWNKRLNCFITKEYLHEKDNKELAIALGRLTYSELQKFNSTASEITRYIVDLIGKKILNPNSLVFWLILIVIIIALLWYGWPVIQSYFSGAASAVSEASLPEKFT